MSRVAEFSTGDAGILYAVARRGRLSMFDRHEDALE